MARGLQSEGRFPLNSGQCVASRRLELLPSKDDRSGCDFSYAGLNKGVTLRRQIMRMALTKFSMLLCVMLLHALLATPAGAQVHVNVNIGAPPPAPIIVQAPPPMLFLQDPGVYVAVGIPYDMFFIGGRYYYFDSGNWFWAPGYGGPWGYVGYSTLPWGLRKFEVRRLREFREREYTVYKVQGPKFKGKNFYAEGGPEWKEHDRGEHDRGEHGKGHKKH